MARKFKIKDKVKVVKNYGDSLIQGFRIGSVGVVADYLSGLPYSYVVENKNGQQEFFKPRELRKR